MHGTIGWPIFWACTALLGLAIAVERLRGDPLRRGALAALGTIWGRWMWVVEPFWRRRITGLEHVGPGPYVIVSNHRSVIDIPALYGLGLPMTVSARPGIFRVPVLGWFVRASGQVDTDDFDRHARAALAAGISVLVFPEGSRNTTGVGRFHLGAFRLALDTGTALLPVATDGAQVILEKGRFFPTDWVAHVRAVVLPPVAPAGDAKALARRIRGEIAKNLPGSP